jgi:hypothetical protein
VDGSRRNLHPISLRKSSAERLAFVEFTVANEVFAVKPNHNNKSLLKGFLKTWQQSAQPFNEARHLGMMHVCCSNNFFKLKSLLMVDVQ